MEDENSGVFVEREYLKKKWDRPILKKIESTRRIESGAEIAADDGLGGYTS